MRIDSLRFGKCYELLVVRLILNVILLGPQGMVWDFLNSDSVWLIKIIVFNAPIILTPRLRPTFTSTLIKNSLDILNLLRI